MALFKIFKGSSDKLYTSEKTKNLVEGYCYFTVDEGKFYIDIASEGDIYEKRVCLNAAQADQLREKRTITLTGDAAGAFQFDGSEDISVEITIAELDEINTAISGKAPKSHASSSTTYGKGTNSKYGHVKLSDSVASETAAASGGVAATPLAVKTAYDLANTANTQANTNLTNITQLQEDVKEISTKATISHASSGTTYGVGSSSNYGHLKLSSSINNSSSTDSGTAATPLAVKTAYDLANAASTTANAASTKADSNEGKITELTTSINSLDSNKAPKSHASTTAATYGAGTGTNFGHVQLSDSTSSTSGVSSSVAATPKAVKTAYDLANSANTKAGTNATDIIQLKEDVKGISTKAPISHASSATTYGVGTNTNYGHLKLSDATNDANSNTSAGTAATPKAVKSAYDLANTAKGIADGAASKASSNETKIGEINTSINNLSSGKAPTNHASSETTYGTGSGDNYGHVKLSASVTDTSGTTSGVAATPSAVKSAYDLANTANTKAGTNASDITQLKEDVKGIATKAPTNHAVNANTYGLGTSSLYGHLKLSDSINSTSSASGGTAATPKAVKSAYDLANTANTTANAASTKAASNEGKITELNGAVNNLESSKAVVSHASEGTTFGVGNETNYGHLKLSSAINSELDNDNATAATPKAVKTAYDLANSANSQAGTNANDIVKLKEDVEEIGTKANIKHDSTTTDFGIGTSANYGHVRLSDSTSSSSTASAGIAATPNAVKTAYDLANTANTTANSNSGKITTLQSTVNDTLTPTVNNHSNKLQYTNITYGTCSTAAATAAKVITIDANAKWELKKGSFITVLFSSTNTASNPTFNVGGTGAKNVYYTTSQITTKNLSYAGYAGRPMNFVFDGTQYRFAGWGVDNNSDTKVTQNRVTTDDANTYPVLLKYNTTTDNGTSTVKFNENINVTPSTGTLAATKFVGELAGKATTAGTADKVANSFTLKGNNTVAGTYNGSAAVSVNIVGAGSTTVKGANGTITITGATIPTKLPNVYSLTIGSVEYDGSQAQTVESLKNPYTLTIQGNGTTLTNGEYDGSAAKTVNITPASIGALAANGTAVKATADANGKNIASTYETKTNVTTKISEALNTAKDYTDTSISSLVNGAPAHLNTLKELADVLGADENMSTTIVGMIGGKADKVHTHKDSEITKSSSWAASKITGTTLDAMLSSIDTHMGDAVSHIQNTTVHITAAERTKWNSAEANQNAFSNIAVSGQTTVAADAKTDTVTFVGSNVTITTDATNDKVTFSVASGSTDIAGIVKLEDSRSSTSTTTAATPNSVKVAYDLANTANTGLNDKISKTNTGVQSIAGGLIIGGTTATSAAKGRLMITGHTNPLIGLQAINANGEQLTPYYFQVANDIMYIGPTSTKALAFDRDGNATIPATLTVTGTISENGTILSEKYASVAHTHTVTHTPAGTISVPTFTGTTATSAGPSATTTVYSITEVGTTPTLTSTVTNRCLKLTFTAGTTPSRSSVTVPTSNHTHSVTATGTVSRPTFTGTAATITSSTPV